MTALTPNLRFVVALASGMALGGCLGTGGGGGGGGGGGTLGGYDREFDRVNGLIATTDMPVSGSADYAGQTRLTITEGGNQIGDVLGDVQLSVAFAPGRTGTISGTADNFRGNLDGEDITFTGSLSSANTALPKTLDISETTVDLPTGGSVTTRTGAMMVWMAGDLSAEGETNSVELQLGGNFFGSGGRAMAGTATAVIDGPMSGTAGGGTFYAERTGR